jgi:hypothetical protein
MPRNGKRTITDNTDLGIGMLIAESEDGSYQRAVSTISEGREIAAGDMCRRMQHLEQGGDPVCPARYLVWAQGDGGGYETVADIEPN